MNTEPDTYSIRSAYWNFSPAVPPREGERGEVADSRLLATEETRLVWMIADHSGCDSLLQNVCYKMYVTRGTFCSVVRTPYSILGPTYKTANCVLGLPTSHLRNFRENKLANLGDSAAFFFFWKVIVRLLGCSNQCEDGYFFFRRASRNIHVGINRYYHTS